MIDPYLYQGTEILRNLAEIKDAELLSQMEADYTCSRLSDLAIEDYIVKFDFETLCYTHYYIFQDIFGWAGKIRTINMEKQEPALGGISIEYTDYPSIEKELKEVLKEMGEYSWHNAKFDSIVKIFSMYMAKLWKVHPFREGNTRTIVTFCSQFIESKGWYIDSELFQDNAAYMRTSLVAATAIFHDLGDRRKLEYLETIIRDALKQGQEMRERIIKQIKLAEVFATEENIKKVVFFNRKEHREHNSNEIKNYLLQ